MTFYKRENYLKRIRSFYDDTETIKVITYVRRCGKSTFMATDFLLQNRNGFNHVNLMEFIANKSKF